MKSRINDQSMPVKISISGRHYPITSLTPSIEVHVEEHNQNDIAHCIRDYIDVGSVPVDEGWSDLEMDVFRQARGVFQWVCLMVPIVQKHMADRDPVEEVQEWVRQVPTELDEMYKHILENVVDRRHQTRSFQLFCWACLAARPLSMRELRYALATYSLSALPGAGQGEVQAFVDRDQVMEQRVKSYSGGLLEVVDSGTANVFKEKKKSVQVIRQSVKDFFIAQGISFFERLVDGAARNVEECHNAV